MKASMKNKRGVVGAVVLAGILAVGGFASTNTLVFEDSTTNASFGEQNVEVITVTDIDYTLDATDKSKVASVDLVVDTFSNPNDDANIWIHPNQKTGTLWEECDENPVTGTATTITCTFATPVDVTAFGEDNTDPLAPVPSDMQVVIAE